MEYILPPAILLLAFLIKLFIDREVHVPDFIYALLELPLNIQFLSLSFSAALLISDKINKDEGALLFIICVIVSLIITFFWRRSLKQFEKDHFKSCIFLGVLNYIISIPFLVFTVNLLMN